MAQPLQLRMCMKEHHLIEVTVSAAVTNVLNALDMGDQERTAAACAAVERAVALVSPIVSSSKNEGAVTELVEILARLRIVLRAFRKNLLSENRHALTH